MKTIIINGSPKGKNGNTEIFIENFTKKIHSDVVVKRIIEEDYKILSNQVMKYDTVIIALPLYIHGMPGIVMKFIEHLHVNDTNNPKKIGFMLQFGFSEGFQGEYIERYFESMSEELNMIYLGTLIKPEAAAIYMLPKIFTYKLFKRLQKFGKIYDETNTFDKRLITKIKQPYKIKGLKLIFFKVLTNLGLTNKMWNKFLKDNKAYEKRFDRPYSI